MTARTHDLAAVTALGLAVLMLPQSSVSVATVLVAVLANQIGGIAPDIDQPTAPLWRNLPEGHVMGKVFDKVIGGHRFLSHSLIGLALFALLARALLQFLHPLMPHVDIVVVWFAFLIGILSHLVMDTLTKEGVPWLLPIPIKFGFPPIKGLRVTTGKHIETLIIFPALLVLDIWLCSTHYNSIVAFVQRHLVH